MIWFLQFAAVLATLSRLQLTNAQLSSANATLEPTAPSLSPTDRPSRSPSLAPTSYPTVSLASNRILLVSATVAVKGLTGDDVKDESDFFALVFADACGVDINEVDVTVESVVNEDQNPSDFYTACNSTGVEINYEVRSEDTTTYTTMRSAMDDGTFVTTFDTGVGNVYDSKKVYVCTELTGDGGASSIITEYQVLSYDEAYPPSPTPSIQEQLWSEYLFLGFFTSLIGVVWLWYLRSDVDDDNIYANDGNNDNKNGNGGNNNKPPKQERAPTTSLANGTSGDTGMADKDANSIEMA